MEPVGVALGVLGLSGLVTVCLDCFHYIQDGRSLGRDFLFLEGQLSAHRIRLYAWAHACGFTRPDGRYDHRLDSPVWQRHIQTHLNAIALLFLDADKIVERYNPTQRYEPSLANADLIQDSPNARFISDGLQKYLGRLRSIRQRTGFLGSTKWALLHKRDFTKLVTQLRECIDALELVTKNLDLFETERRAVEIEIESITDTEMLQNMISEPVSPDANSDVVSEAASQRLVRITENLMTASTSLSTSSRIASTFVTARTRPDETLQDIAEGGDLGDSQASQEAETAQHIRIMESIIAKTGSTKVCKKPITLNDSRWGEKLATLKYRDEKNFKGSPWQLGFLPKRIFKELKLLLNDGDTQFITARILENTGKGTNARLRVSFEGPPQSSYSGGIFHLLWDYGADYPWIPPKARFLTRIYHPNIDSDGNICMDILGTEWGPFYHIGSIIVSLISLLSDPTVDDPLVPEIAATYVEDREVYEQNARNYTAKFAGTDQCWEHYGVTPDMFENESESTS